MDEDLGSQKQDWDYFSKMQGPVLKPETLYPCEFQLEEDNHIKIKSLFLWLSVFLLIISKYSYYFQI